MKKYTKSGHTYPCRLEMNELVELITIIKETFATSDRKEDFELFTSISGIFITSYSIEEFLEHKELPDTLNFLSLKMVGWNKNRDLDKTVNILFGPYNIDLNVYGSEQTWVLGKYSQIFDFFKKKRPWFWALYKIFPWYSGIIVLLFFKLFDFIKADSIIYSISTAIFLTMSILAYIYYFKGKFLSYTQIFINPKKLLFNKENITIIIGLLTLIFTIIGGVIVPFIINGDREQSKTKPEAMITPYKKPAVIKNIK